MIRVPLRIAVALVLSLLQPGVHAQELEIITLRYRTAEELVPVLRPLLQPGGSLSGAGDKLLVRTTPDNLAQLRAALQQLDTAPRRLLITVRHNVETDSREAAAGISGEVEVDDNARVVVRRSGPGGSGIEYRDRDGNRVDARVRSTRHREESGDTQRVQVLEGRPALIGVGQSVPMLERSVIRDRHGTEVQDSLVYRDVTRGFYVLPRVSGDQVTLDVSPHRDTLSRTQGGAVELQHMQTTVSGRVGEWLEVGGVVEDTDLQSREPTATARTRSRDTRRVLIKVEVLP
jgi:type II secretory pathway component GspD/PulD (secretin)